MLFLGLYLDWFSISSLFLVCVKFRLLLFGKEIYGFVFRNGLEMDLFLIVLILIFYFYCDKLYYVRVLFDRVEYRNLVFWNVMIIGYLYNGSLEEVLDIFRDMFLEGIWFNEIVLTSMFGVCL